LRGKQTYFAQSVSAVLVALAATLVVVWEQALVASPAPRPEMPVIRAGQRAVRLNALEKQKEMAERASSHFSKGGRGSIGQGV